MSIVSMVDLANVGGVMGKVRHSHKCPWFTASFGLYSLNIILQFGLSYMVFQDTIERQEDLYE